VYSAFENSAVTVTKGAIVKYASSSTTLRGFCPNCGTTMTAEADFLPGELHFHVGAFDRPEEFVPMGSVFTEERLPWVRIHEPPFVQHE
jgi:hypothetical protein